MLAQVVYYFHAWAELRRQTGCKELYFSVPTGNFGDIFAGYVAKRMGLPIKRLILATNENNILSRFVRDGDYSVGSVVPTLSPSMDIQVASNFERYLFYLFDENPEQVKAAMAAFQKSGSLPFDAAQRARVAEDFLALTVNTDQTVATIRDFFAATGYTLDPHTAVGVKAAKELAGGEVPVVCLATAHPAKFGEAVLQATGKEPLRPASLAGIEEREKRCEVIAADTAAVKAYLEGHAL